MNGQKGIRVGNLLSKSIYKLEKITEQVSTYCHTLRGLIKINEDNYSKDEQSEPHETIDVLISV